MAVVQDVAKERAPLKGAIRPAVDMRNLLLLGGLWLFDAAGLLGRIGQTAMFDEMRRSTLRGASRPVNPSRRVLFLSMKGTWRTHLAWEYVLAHALRMRGADCTFLLNDDSLPKTDVQIHNNPGRLRSRVSAAYSRLFAKYLGLPSRWVSEFVSPAVREELRRIAFDTPVEALDDIERGGIPVGRAIRPSLVRFFRRGSVPATPYGERVHREFVWSGLLALDAFTALIDELRPEAVVAVNGKMYAENLMFRLCRSRGIDVFTYERGKIKDTINFVRNQISVDWDNEYAWKAYADRELTAEESQRIHAYVDERKAGANTVLHFNPNPEEDETLIRRTAGYDPAKKHFLLLTNIVWDSAVQDKDIAFASMFDWVTSTIEFFRGHPEANLIVRIHPAEIKISSDITMEKVSDYLAVACPDLPANVTVIPPESDVASYSLFALSDAILVYTSTVGLETAMEEIPTVVCGETHYSGKGFTVDIGDAAQYRRVLGDLIDSGAFPAMDWTAAWKYAYVFFFKCMLPFPHVSEDAIGRLGSQLPRSDAELAVGRDAHLDLVCDAVLNGTQAVP